jgi:8-oxo-dGTP pyrophosphatase MutT (NUDIX family)
MTEKACPVVLRRRGGLDILAFRHPLHGLQLVKGTIEPHETPETAAVRELAEEAGILEGRAAAHLAAVPIDETTWHFVLIFPLDLPETWTHHCEDEGHDFAFFWHPLDADGGAWHPYSIEALTVIRAALARERWGERQ